MIIDLTYLIKEPLMLPNISENPNSGVNNNALFDGYLNQFEYDFLLHTLGYELTEDLLSQFESDGEWKADATQKWKDLVDGKNNWRGLRFLQNGIKKSLIAHYVYCQILYKESSKLTSVGNSVNEVSGGLVVSNWQKIVPIWQELVELYQGSRKDGLKTLQEYLKENESDFESYKFNHFNNINSFQL